MSIEQAEVVDVIGIEGTDVVLTISDHLDWDDEGRHLGALQDKLNTYLAFFEGGELLASYPDAAGKAPVIDLVVRVAPSIAGNKFLERVRPVLKEAGLELRVRVLSE
jgi:hypothetical protein